MPRKNHSIAMEWIIVLYRHKYENGGFCLSDTPRVISLDAVGW